MTCSHAGHALPRALLQLRHLGTGCATQKLWPGQLAALSTRAQPGEGAAAYKDCFQSPPASLEADRGRVAYPPQLEGNPLGRALLRLVGAYGTKQQLANGASILYHAVTEAAENQRLQSALGLEPVTFMSTHNLLALHMWLILNRISAEDKSTKAPFQQMLYTDQFYRDMERRVYRDGVTLHVGKWLKKLEQITYGGWYAYDRALEGGERSALVDALVKNVYRGDGTMRPYAELAAKYLNRERECLQLTPVDAIYKGHVKFSLDIR
ncbi:MAG: ubiquinol-cytochrome C chaperone-domain-containing protein [Monoraphidium minutum]|nr:MAG: ubiquinol-cytochrome C chaperone-domain-containing protein [Monoraphidium minutum]